MAVILVATPIFASASSQQSKRFPTSKTVTSYSVNAAPSCVNLLVHNPPLGYTRDLHCANTTLALPGYPVDTSATLARNHDDLVCPPGTIGCVEVTYTPMAVYNGFWFNYPLEPHDAKRCDPSLELASYIAVYCQNYMRHFQVTYNVQPAKVGDQCGGAPFHIADNLDSPKYQVYNITQVAADAPWNSGPHSFVPLGWIYTDQYGDQWFQGSPGTTLGVRAGSLAFGANLSQAVILITAVPGDIFNGLKSFGIKMIGGSGFVHSVGCFTHQWDGKASG